MTNQEIIDAFNDIYGGFWKKYRDIPLERHSSEWNEVVEEAKELMNKHLFPLAGSMINEFLDELEDRCGERERMVKQV